jgi:hypothetical protein
VGFGLADLVAGASAGVGLLAGEVAVALAAVALALAAEGAAAVAWAASAAASAAVSSAAAGVWSAVAASSSAASGVGVGGLGLGRWGASLVRAEARRSMKSVGGRPRMRAAASGLKPSRSTKTTATRSDGERAARPIRRLGRPSLEGSGGVEAAAGVPSRRRASMQAL